MLATCHEHGIKPVVTFHHLTSPRWLMRYGGWLDEKTPERFARYCERAVKHLGDLVSVACTVNEPNLPVLLSKMLPFNLQETPFWQTAAQTFGVLPERLGLFQIPPDTKMP
jgi:beta-glucosidase